MIKLPSQGHYAKDYWLNFLVILLTLKSKPLAFSPLVFFKYFIFRPIRPSFYLQFLWFNPAFAHVMNKFIFFLIFSMWVFFHEHSRITGLQRKREDMSLTPHYHFHPLHRHLDTSRAITAESSPLHIASSRTQTGNSNSDCFPSASR